MMENEKCLDDKEYFRYAGKCRHCGFENEWVVEKKAKKHRVFAKYVQEQLYPNFIEYCGDCENMAVYELTAYQKRGDNITKELKGVNDGVGKCKRQIAW